LHADQGVLQVVRYIGEEARFEFIDILKRGHDAVNFLDERFRSQGQDSDNSPVIKSDRQMPEIALRKNFENIDYSKLITYELLDETDVKKELACAGGTCEIE